MNSSTEIPTISSPTEATGEYREMLIRLMTRQLYAETATAEVFGRSIGAAPTWREKRIAAEFALEETQHSQMLCDLLPTLAKTRKPLLPSALRRLIFGRWNSTIGYTSPCLTLL